MVFAHGYTQDVQLNLDGLGWVYLSIITFWTVTLMLGIAFLLSKRRLQFLRMRNIPLAIGAVLTLHIYWVLCVAAYVLQGYFPCSAEFWIMSIYLPLGIALFQACNTQLLHIAGLQRRYVTDHESFQKDSGAGRKNLWHRWLAHINPQNQTKRAVLYITYGMVVQTIAALTVFFVSRKFHPKFGFPVPAFRDPFEGCFGGSGLHTHFHTCAAASRTACRRGWEWIPSIMWQAFWSWCYAPYLLWKVRDIRDNHGWRTQTVFCGLAGLLATPMWLCALYIPKMSFVNKYYIPPLWFTPSIFCIEASLIFIPCWQVIKNSRLQSETLEIIAEWESKNNGSSTTEVTSHFTSKASQKPSTNSSTSSRRGELYTMQALDSCLRANSQPLLNFAATKDFSGENISFLSSILEWKRAWTPSSPSKSGFLRRPSIHEVSNKSLQRRQFERAVHIYASHISLAYSNYPLNLSSVHLKQLEAVFEGAAMVIHGQKLCDANLSNATPFEKIDFNFWLSNKPYSSPDQIEPNPNKHDDLLTKSFKTQCTSSADKTLDIIFQTDHHLTDPLTFLRSYEARDTITEQLPDFVPVPPSFNPDVFDQVEESIKYMVLTNTWPKFVNAGYASTELEKKKTSTRSFFFEKLS